MRELKVKINYSNSDDKSIEYVIDNEYTKEILIEKLNSHIYSYNRIIREIYKNKIKTESKLIKYKNKYSKKEFYYLEKQLQEVFERYHILIIELLEKRVEYIKEIIKGIINNNIKSQYEYNVLNNYYNNIYILTDKFKYLVDCSYKKDKTLIDILDRYMIDNKIRLYNDIELA